VLGSRGWLRFDFPYAQARPSACRIELGDEGSVGHQPTASFDFEPVNQYLLQIERYSRFLRGDGVPSWPIEDTLGTLRVIEALLASARSGSWQTLAA
jgi:predicted dehydrogenase